MRSRAPALALSVAALTGIAGCGSGSSGVSAATYVRSVCNAIYPFERNVVVRESDGADHFRTLGRMLAMESQKSVCGNQAVWNKLADALLVHRSGGAFEARSAGSHPKPLHPAAVRVMGRRGIDISGNVSKHLDTFAGIRFDRVITLCDKVREVCPDFPGSSDPVHWSMPDPSAEPDADGDAPVERTADELEERIALLVPDLAPRS